MISTHVIAMIFSGLLSGMYVWSDKWSDVRLSLNDIYMVALMTGWMVLFLSLTHKHDSSWIWSAGVILLALMAIRTQAFVTPRQFYTGMIPHHSMAILMSRRLLEKNPGLPEEDRQFVEKIIQAQTDEIEWMKKRLS
jgi:uncharacterized protein (DUF305 family)